LDGLPETAWNRLEALNWRGAIVGPCGSGKTTLLEAVEHRFRAQGMAVSFWRLSTDSPRLPHPLQSHPIVANEALLVDGAEQLSAWNWYRLRRHARHAGAFVITSHRPLSLPLWLQTSTSPALLQKLVEQLGEHLSDEEARSLWQATRGNLRLALWQLYDQYAMRDAEF
jgi:hypothetical protein